VNVERFLPLTPVVLEIALSLAAGERHGYEIMQDVERARPTARSSCIPARSTARSAASSIRD
jgi:hypothetical protein